MPKVGEREIKTAPFTTEAALTDKRLVRLTTNGDRQVTTMATAGDTNCVGLYRADYTQGSGTASGTTVGLVVGGVAYCTASGSINAGEQLTTASGGQVIPIDDAAVSGAQQVVHVGQAMEDATNGNDIAVELKFGVTYKA